MFKCILSRTHIFELHWMNLGKTTERGHFANTLFSCSNVRRIDLIGGETGIRTLDPLARITVFETAPIGRSGISP